MNALTLTNPKNGETISSTFADHAEAANALAATKPTGEFPRSLLSAFADAVTKGWSFSPARAFWLHRLAMEAVSPAPAQQGVPLDTDRLAVMFGKAAAHLKNPAVVLRDGGVDVKFYVAGDRSKHPGSVMVVEQVEWPARGRYFGRLAGGAWFPASAGAQVEGLVRRFAANPEAVASEHGHLTGKCCFCRRALTDARSTEVGYGPVCAEKFGLRWGKT